MKIILALFIIVFFIPIPIKILFFYKDKNAVLKIYSKNINLNKSMNITNASESVNKGAVMNSTNKGKSFYFLILKDYLKRLSSTKFKPKLILGFSFKYSTNDAAVTSLIYPLINEFLSLVCTILKIPFKLKFKTVSITPEYKNKVDIYLVINCIFIVNIVKLTYMIILLLISYLGGLKHGKSSNRKFNEVNFGKS